MNKLFKPKCINRIVVFLALLAPIIYLFGTMGTYLMGAHGSLVLAQHETTIVTDVEYEGVSYPIMNHGVNTEYYFSCDSDLIGDYGPSFYIYDDVLDIWSSGEDDYLSSWPTSLPLSGLQYTLGIDNYFALIGYFITGGFILETDEIALGDVWCFSFGAYESMNERYSYYEIFYNEGDVYTYFYCLYDGDSSWYLEDEYANGTLSLSFLNDDVPLVYMGGFRPDDAGLNAIRHIPAYYSVTESDDYVENSDYLFGQMFPRDNFLAKVGQNALSDNPMGFAPFGWLLSYLDQNMLHMGVSQLAQMGYGYFYWCAHVLLLDVIFYFAVFFLRFVKHLGDMFIKEE